MSLAPRTQKAVKNLKITLSLPGDVVEMGVWRGDTTVELAKLLKRAKSGKKVYACDTFDGLPYDGRAGLDDMLKKGECTASFERFWENVLSAGVQDYVIPVPGLIEETLYTVLPDHKFCFAFLDMDLYEPTSYATRYLDSRIVLGGVLGYHDYKFERCPGIEIVVDKELNRRKFRMFDDHAGNCAWLQKVRR
jgi:O-methyltransferase